MEYQEISWQLRKLIAKAVLDTFGKPEMEIEAISLEHPTLEQNGDYSTNVALVLAKRLGENPREIAEKIVENLAQSVSKDLLEKIDVAGAGFVNFYLSSDWLIQKTKQVLVTKEKYGSSERADVIGKWGTVVVEYSSPNIAKPFGIGHLRSTIIGDSIQKILKFQGYQVVTDNHLGDWGTQFGKLCYAINTWGNEKEIFESQEPVKSLVRLYARFHSEAENDDRILDLGREWFARLEKGDAEARRLWKLCVDASMKEFLEIYDLLGVSFDFYNGEAFFEDKLSEIVEIARKSKYVRENDGALLVFFPDEKKTPLMLLKSDGSTLYATRDLATDKYRIDKYGKDTFIINETGLDQGFYWQQVFEAEELLGICKASQRYAVLHGLMLSGGSGKKFSTRKGDELWLKDVLDEAVERSRKIMEERKIGDELAEEEKFKIARAVGIGALKYNDLKQGHQKDILFDWDKVINIEGDSGPYLQYTYARAKSVIRKAGGNEKEINSELSLEEVAILRWIYRFPEVVELAAKNYSPNLICSFLFELAKRFNGFYNNQQILGSDSRLKLTEGTAIVLKNGLDLLGIEVLERM